MFWWARRPLVACRAAVYGALVPASRFVPENGPDNKKQSLGRANAAKFVERLCKYPGDPRVIQQAQEHILEAHVERLTAELAEAAKTGRWPGWVEEFKWPKDKPTVTREDIEAGRAPRPRVLDVFAGGGAIPLEALRLGCEAYALDLNPVAHIIELCTLVYPQKYGKPDPNARGMTGLPAPRRYWTYVIKCSDDSFYIGQTDNLIRRYEDHLKGKVEWTAGRDPLELVHWEAFDTREEAVQREKWLKTGFGRKWIKREYKAGRLAERQAGPRNAKGLPASLEGLAQPGETTWGGLAEEVRYWGQWVLREVKKEIGDLYPPVPDPEYRGKRPEIEFDRKTGNWVVKDSSGKDKDALFETEGGALAVPPGYLMPIAYLRTRTVTCKNPSCHASIPLLRQTWLCRTRRRYVALKPIPDRKHKRVSYKVVERRSAPEFDFDPSEGARGGNVACPFCETVCDSDYVKQEGCAGRLGQQSTAVVCVHHSRKGKVYVAVDEAPMQLEPSVTTDQQGRPAWTPAAPDSSVSLVPQEPLEANPRSFDIQRYGVDLWKDLFTPKELYTLTTFCHWLRQLPNAHRESKIDEERSVAISAVLSLALDKLAERSTSVSRWNAVNQVPNSPISAGKMPMVMDYAVVCPLGRGAGSWESCIEYITAAIRDLCSIRGGTSELRRADARKVPFAETMFDAVITDPPYYDNVSYSNLADFFYVWEKRSIGNLFPEHYASLLTPKKNEIIAAIYRHGGSKDQARYAYEKMMTETFSEAHRLLKPSAPMVCVYAHKTTLGWATLVEALREAGFTVEEAWPLDTERVGRENAQEMAALASSIFLVGRKREESTSGSYESDVQPELQEIVRERVETLWKQGISGADLLIACVGAGLRAFTRFARVEYANGEEVPAERFLAEVETVVLETILARLSKEIGGLPAASRDAAQTGNGGRRTSLSGVDPATRFYLLWRYTYRWTELDAGEAIVFANGTHVELDGPGSLSYGSRPLVKKKKGKYRLLDFTERGKDEKLGLPADGQPAPLIDALHRTLWLMENRPLELPEFLREAQVNREQMRLVAQALAGPALKGSELMDVSPTGELAALAKLTANWRAVVEDAALTPLEREARRTGQQILFDKETDT